MLYEDRKGRVFSHEELDDLTMIDIEEMGIHVFEDTTEELAL